MVGTVAMITYYFGVGRERLLLKTMRQVLVIFILINILTYCVFPNGLYVTELINTRADKRNTFLGNRNSYKYYGLFVIFVTYLENKLDNEELNFKMIFVLALSLLDDFLGESLTGIIVISFITLVYLFRHLLSKIKLINAKSLFIAAVAVFVFIIGFVSVGKYTNLLAFLFHGNVTFSNRVRIWSASIDIIRKHPLLGIGTQSTTVIVPLIYNLHAHNQFLEIALRSGILGLILYVKIIWDSFAKAEYIDIAFVAICLFGALIINMMEVETYAYAIVSYFSAFIYSYYLRCNKSELNKPQ
jgi:O-antigen ligase